MNGLCLHAGATHVSLSEIAQIKIPPGTDSYTPISHADLVDMAQGVALRTLTPQGFVHDCINLAVAKDGARMFGVSRFKSEENNEIGLGIGFRNSYDKSMKAGIVVGASVFVCDNLAFSGEFVAFRRHTGDAMADLMTQMIVALYSAGSSFKESMLRRLEQYKQMRCTLDQGMARYYLLARHDAFNRNVLQEAERMWDEVGRQEPTLWRWYNCATAAAKFMPLPDLLPAVSAISRYADLISDGYDGISKEVSWQANPWSVVPLVTPTTVYNSKALEVIAVDIPAPLPRS